MRSDVLPAAGLILAGGDSTRMGRDKLRLPWGEGTLLSRIAAEVAATLVETWVVGPFQPGLAAEIPGIRLVSDEPRIGPLGGLRAGLAAMAAEAGVVVAADMPFVTSRSLRRLWEISGDAPVVVLRTADGLHPLFGVYRKACLPAVEDAIRRGDHRMRSFWAGLPVRVIDVVGDPFWKHTLFNINSSSDYQRALELQGPHRSAPG
ncbi:MAG: molybdenum cofactor guanylyltransferase [Acidobacteria bacterium]|nr:molybdenum cofactor guanylyltransferase [Acidobacteriota bacterium]